MARITYEMGVRGEESDVSLFEKEMLDYIAYSPGQNRDSNDKSFVASQWFTTTTDDEFRNTVIKWTTHWSRQCPTSEAYYSFVGGSVGDRTIYYGRFKDGAPVDFGIISNHDMYEAVMPKFGYAPCECSTGWYETHPIETPFADCPIRLNPPTQWAVEHLTHAMDTLSIGRAR